MLASGEIVRLRLVGSHTTSLVTQAKNKYNTPKYRLVVRFSNKTITAQVSSLVVSHVAHVAGGRLRTPALRVTTSWLLPTPVSSPALVSRLV